MWVIISCSNIILMKIIKTDKIPANRTVYVVSSQYTRDLEELFEEMIGYIPTEVYCFTNELGTRYYFEEVE